MGVGLSAILPLEKKFVCWYDNYTEYMSVDSENTGYGATNYARYCNRLDESLRYDNSYISLHSES